MTYLEQMLAKSMEAQFMAAMLGNTKPARPTALRLRNGRIETVQLDDAGNIIEPPAPCCHPWGGLHAPNCKTWGGLT